jgi:hypothetical protein
MVGGNCEGLSKDACAQLPGCIYCSRYTGGVYFLPNSGGSSTSRKLEELGEKIPGQYNVLTTSIVHSVARRLFSNFIPERLSTINDGDFYEGRCVTSVFAEACS